MALSIFSAKPFDIRKGEYQKAFLMFSYIFLVIAVMMILKPVNNSLFLSRFGARQLPYAFILVALASALVSAVNARDRARRTDHQIMTASLTVSIVMLMAFRAAFFLGFSEGWILYLLFVMVELFSVVTAAQFWLLANQVYDAREAGRLFGFLGTGAVSGGIVGGYLTRILAPILSTENMILVAAALVAVSLLLLQVIFRKSAPELSLHKVRKRGFEPPDSRKSTFEHIAGSSLLLHIAGIIGIGVIAATLADYLFEAVASETIRDKDRLTAFFGFWLSNLNIISLVVQVFLTSKVLKNYGVRASLLFLPIGLLFGSVGVLALPVLWTVIMIKFSDGAFKHSINRSGVELLYLPVPADIKARVKTYIDVGVKNVATGIAGIIIILLTTAADLSLRFVGLACLLVVILWLAMVTRVKRNYVEAFRQAILKRSIDVESQQVNLEDADIADTITKVLEGDNERQILYVFDLLGDSGTGLLEPYLKPLLDHPSRDVKAKVLEIAVKYESPDLSPQAKNLIADDDVGVSVKAVRYLCARAENGAASLRNLLASDDQRLRCSAMISAAWLSKDDDDIRQQIDTEANVKDLLGRIESAGTPEDMRLFMKERLAELIEAGEDPSLFDYLGGLLDDKDTQVRCAAARSAAAIKAVKAIPVLIGYLASSGTRACAMESLAAFGEIATDSLAASFDDERTERSVRLKIPRVIAMIGSQRSVDILTKRLGSGLDLHLDYEILKGLVDLRVDFSGLRFDRKVLERFLIREVERYHTIMSIVKHIEDPVSIEEIAEKSVREDAVERSRQFLKRVLEERRVLSLKRMFRFLSLRYPPVDMYNAYLGITSGSRNLRANALEFLDNVLGPGLKRTVVPLVEHFSDGAASEDLHLPKGYSPPGGDDPLEIMLEHEDKWVRISALYMIGETGYSGCTERINGLEADEDAVVRETAAWCLERLGLTA